MNWHKYNNPAGYIGFTSIAFSLALSIAYTAQRDYRRALYFFFAACITATVVL
jgi:uncharacterized membrane protein